MAKLILSSRDFRDEKTAECIRCHLPCPIEKCRVLYFPNEKATAERIRSGGYHGRLVDFGFSRENIRVFDYFSPVDFDAAADIDAVYISGGNTFGTLKRIRESGADRLIIDLVKKGAVYIGGSAGAHIACSSVAHTAKYDSDTVGLTDHTGLGLFDGILICHYTDERRADYAELLEREKCVIRLRDEDCIVIEK